MEKKVLIVDDDPSMLRLLNKFLTSAGYAVFSAGDGVEGLGVFRAEGPLIVVTDWLMPRMDGLELCRAIRAEKGRGYVYIVILTAQSGRSHLIEALEAGVDDYVAKPVDRAELLARLRTGERILRLEGEAVERCKIEQERNHLQDAVRALERVLGVVGHELRTPLAGVRAMVEFLLQEVTRDTAEFDTFLGSIHEEIVKMAATVNDTLEVARMNSGSAQWNWSEVRVLEICDSALDTIRPLVDHAKTKLALDVSPHDLVMNGDPGAIRRLVVNLLSNAHKHTPEGSISVRAASVSRDDGSWVEIQVGDTGEGMPPEIAGRLGVAFALNSGVVGETNVKGSGLGLAICKGIVAAHGGSISVDTAPGEGTTVTVLVRADLSEPAPIDNAANIACEVAK